MSHKHSRVKQNSPVRSRFRSGVCAVWRGFRGAAAASLPLRRQRSPLSAALHQTPCPRHPGAWGRESERCSTVYRFHRVLPNAHSSTLFFSENSFLKNMSWKGPHLKFLQICLNSESVWWWSSVYNFNSARALKMLLSADVEVTSTLPNSNTHKDLLMYT